MILPDSGKHQASTAAIWWMLLSHRQVLARSTPLIWTGTFVPLSPEILCLSSYNRENSRGDGIGDWWLQVSVSSYAANVKHVGSYIEQLWQEVTKALNHVSWWLLLLIGVKNDSINSMGSLSLPKVIWRSALSGENGISKDNRIWAELLNTLSCGWKNLLC